MTTDPCISSYLPATKGKLRSKTGSHCVSVMKM